jgi:hypothetical protein
MRQQPLKWILPAFIASLDPQLRQDVLMDQDEGFIQTLPTHIIAEAGGYRQRAPPPILPGSAQDPEHQVLLPMRLLHASLKPPVMRFSYLTRVAWPS